MYVYMYVCVYVLRKLYALYIFSLILFFCVYIDLALAVFLLQQQLFISHFMNTIFTL